MYLDNIHSQTQKPKAPKSQLLHLGGKALFHSSFDFSPQRSGVLHCFCGGKALLDPKRNEERGLSESVKIEIACSKCKFHKGLVLASISKQIRK